VLRFEKGGGGLGLGDDAKAPEGLAAFVDWLPEHHRATLQMRPEVMVLAARYGDGHLRAAKGITLALLAHWPQIRVGLLDYYGFVNPALDNFIRWCYMTSVRYVPWAWRWFYESTQYIDPRGSTQAMLNRIGIRQFYEAIREAPPEIIVSTYPTAAGVVATLKRQGLVKAANLVVMTDYAVHSQWIHDGVDKYFVGCDDMVEELKARGIPENRVEVSGIPVDQRFGSPVDRSAVLASLGLPDQPTILYMGGSYLPQHRFERVLRHLARISTPHNLIIVAGREPARYQAAQSFAHQSRHPVAALGYVNNVHELMGIAALLISKAGGLTVTEALCRGLPQLIFRQIPGQEDANAAFLVRHGAGVVARTEEEVAMRVEHLLNHPLELMQMARRSRELGRPHATHYIARRIAEARERHRLDASS
jgi:processive 1,2-diacylglycerol beta-glucosyltransferase